MLDLYKGYSHCHSSVPMFESLGGTVYTTSVAVLVLVNLAAVLADREHLGANQVTTTVMPVSSSPPSNVSAKAAGSADGGNPGGNVKAPGVSGGTPGGNDPLAYISDGYTQWSEWGNCTKACQQSRVRKCKNNGNCGGSWFRERRVCKGKGHCSKRSYRSFKLLGIRKSDKLMEDILYKLLYGNWSSWGPCSRNCKKRRIRKCMRPAMCGRSYIQEERYCRKSRSFCRKQYTLNTDLPVDEIVSRDIEDRQKKGKNVTIVTSGGKHTGSTLTGSSENRLKSHPSVLNNMAAQCGIRPRKRRGSYRIVGGLQVHKHSWPWQVAILQKYKEQFCGGTLIAPQWVLTAAHCVRKKRRKRKIFVRVGEHDIYAYDKGEDILKLSKDFPHPKYDFDSITNDIALLKLERAVTPSERVGFACLPDERDKFPEGTICHILGWGKEKNTDVFGSTILKQAKVPLVNRHTCQKVFDYNIHDTQVCAGYRKGGLDSCAGDSGGPLLCPKTVGNETRWVVYGVTSYGEGCGEKGKFGIYTKVRKYLDWINDVIDSN